MIVVGFLDWLRGFRDDTDQLPEVSRLAVPLTPAEVATLVEALNEAHRLTRKHRPDISGGGSFDLSEAQAVAYNAGVAAALGHPVVPLPVRSIRMYDYVLDTFLRYEQGSPIGKRLALLLTRLHMLAGMAQVHRWRTRWDEVGVRWDGDPPTVPGGAAPSAPCADGIHEADHYQTAGWVGRPGECGVQCVCGTTFNNFDTLAEAVELLEVHIAAASSSPTSRGD